MDAFFWYSLVVVNTLIFLYEFFPLSTSFYDSTNTLQDHIINISVPRNIDVPKYDAFIFIVIDALRLDFVTKGMMPESSRLVKENGCLITLKAETPTVTMPRIKALTSGSVPQFIDIVKNLASPEILKDSWLHAAKRKNKIVIFYGDDTWLKLYPDLFDRYEGTTSFFVTDFTEVDNNVTRNVDIELNNADWNIMILHYLGLDHIGHVYGPNSTLVPKKLQEMDHIVARIHSKVFKNRKAMLLVTGDHGMKDGGGHGGSTYHETHVPLLVIGHSCQTASFPQTDLPVNIAMMLGLGIPTTSMGQVQHTFFTSYPEEYYLYTLWQNTKFLSEKKNICINEFERATTLHLQFLSDKNDSFASEAAKLYKECSQKISEYLLKSSVNQNVKILISSVLLIFNILAVFIYIAINPKARMSVAGFVILSVITLLQCIIDNDIAFILTLVVLVLKFIITTIQCLKLICIDYEQLSIIHAVIFLHPLIFFSSSFIEEEHQYWYFFFNTVVLILIHKQFATTRFEDLCKVLLVLVFFRFIRRLTSVGDQWGNYPDISDWLLKEDNYIYYLLFFVTSLVLLFLSFQYGNFIEKLHITSILFLGFVAKILLTESSTIVRVIWLLIILHRKHSFVLAAVLLLKPYNVILVPFCLYANNVFAKLFDSKSILILLNILLANCLYFAQGHSNTLSSVDVSIGYLGLNSYVPVIVTLQILLHTYIFHFLCHISTMSSGVYRDTFWLTLFVQRTANVAVVCLICLVNRHHLFIWSVFAPKLFIEGINVLVLFVEYCLYKLYCCKRVFFISKCDLQSKRQ